MYENISDKQEKTVWPEVSEISPVSIHGGVYGGKDLRKRCVLSLEWKIQGVIGGESGQCGSDVCRSGHIDGTIWI